MKQQESRRQFLERAGLGLAGASVWSGMAPRGAAQSRDGRQATWKPPAVVTNPNILIIMLDQMRWPSWLTSAQVTLLQQTLMPNIMGKLRNNSYVFQQYYTAATVCTAARGTLLTGLYAPQTAVYLGADQLKVPPLQTAFPTWASALQALNPAYQNNCWWFGKWHLSPCWGSSPLLPYGFQTRTYPGGANCTDPTGSPNEGTDGGVNLAPGQDHGVIFASDAMIAGDFGAWLPGAPVNSPWCATVSFVNPHDIASAPLWLKYPLKNPSGLVWFEPPTWFTTTGAPPNELNPPPGSPQVYSPDNSPNQTLPNPWNFENLATLGGQGSGGIKPAAQLAFQSNSNKAFGAVNDWTLFLNQYYWLQQYVDTQVGVVLAALQNSQFAGNTIVIFTSDHGEYAGSHGLHDKGYAAYDESIHVPLSVQFPGQTGSIAMNQMCSSVDFFRLICDLGTSGATGTAGGPFLSQFPDQQNRQQIWNFLYNNSAETRVASSLASGGLQQPYIFHTCDITSDATQTTKVHVCCLRGKSTGPQPAKMVLYWEWANCTTYPDGVAQDYEFYDYSLLNQNSSELGNNYNGNGVTGTGTPNLTLQNNYLNAMGSWAGWSSPIPGAGLIATELNAPLVGNGSVNGQSIPLSQAQASGQQAYFDYVFGKGVCPVGST